MKRNLQQNPQRNLQQLLVPSGATLLQAMRVIDRGACEIAFVCDTSRRVVGTLTDGDVRRALLAGAAPSDRVLRNAMQPDFSFVDARVGRPEVLDLMRARGLSQIPVLDSRGRLEGLHLLREFLGSELRSNWAVILAGGQGIRLRPITENIPKPMIMVAGRPILERLVLQVVSAGIRRIFLAINYLGHVIERHFGSGERFGCRIEYLREKKPLGTGGPLALLPRPPHDPVLVMNGDLVTDVSIHRMMEFHESGGFAATVGLRPHAVQVPFGVADVRGKRITRLREKPTQRMLVNAGIYVISPRAVRIVPRREYPITALVDTCLERHLPVGAFLIEQEWIDVGEQDQLRRARGEL